MDNTDLTSKKWYTLQEAAAVLGISDRAAHGLMKRNSIVTERGDKVHLWSGRQVRALAERNRPGKKVSVPAAAPVRKPTVVDGDCGVCHTEKAHFSGVRRGERIALCFRCFNDNSYTAVRHGQSVQVVTA